MLKVKNGSVVRRLAAKSYKNDRKRNMAAIIAIMLTCVLFTALFTMGFGILKSAEYNSMRMSGGMAHASLKYLNEEQFEKLTSHPLIKEAGKRIYGGVTSDDKLLKRPVELDYADETACRLSFIDISEGRAPEAENEVVLDDITLDMLKLPHEVGQKITLDVDFADRVETIDFVLSGWYEGDAGFTGSIGLVSESFIQKYLSGRGQNYHEDFDINGSISSEIMFSDSLNISGELYSVITDAGYTMDENGANNIEYGINWAYMSTSLDDGFGTVIAIAMLILIIVFAGYLIIYNIFRISVVRDIRFYGLLKTIGTTGRQIRRILTRQALRMCIIGIPIGLAAGFLVGTNLVPVVASMLNGGETYISTNPIIFIGAAVFTLVTVFISCYKPARIAARISPVEAVKYNGVENINVKKAKLKKSRGGAKLHRMAFSNLGRSRRRTAITITSMALSLVVMNVVFCLANSFDMDKYVSNFINVDYQLGQAGYFNSKYPKDEEPMSDTFIDAFEAQEGVLDGGCIYTDYSKNLHAYYTGETEWYGMKTVYKEGDAIPTNIYAMDEYPLSTLKIVEGEYDAEKFATGDYLLIGGRTDDYGIFNREEAIYDVGEQVTLKECLSDDLNPDIAGFDEEAGLYVDKEGNHLDNPYVYKYGDVEKTYTIMGYYELSYSNNSRGYGYGATFAMPISEFEKWGAAPKRMTYTADADSTYDARLENFLKTYTTTVEPTMDYVSKEVYKQEFEQFRGMLVIIGGALSAIIGLIGLLNFANSVSMSIIARQKEFAMLRSIGMTNGQLRRMLMFEGLFYAGLTVVASVAATLLVSFTAVKLISDMFWFMSFKLTLLPVLIAGLFLIGFALVIPIASYRSNARKTLVEELRESVC